MSEHGFIKELNVEKLENVSTTYQCPSVSLLANVSGVFRRALAPVSSNLVPSVCKELSPDTYYCRASRHNTGYWFQNKTFNIRHSHSTKDKHRMWQQRIWPYVEIRKLTIATYRLNSWGVLYHVCIYSSNRNFFSFYFGSSFFCGYVCWLDGRGSCSRSGDVTS